MSFETPAALWALASLLLLVLFSLWRQAAERVTVPSLLLWKKIPERNPPIRALRRPRWRLELLLQGLAIAAAVAALAGPYRDTAELQPRRVALLFDTSARLRAGDRLEKAKARAAALWKEHLQSDEVLCYAASPSPRSFRELARVQSVDAHVDLAPLLAAARASSDHVVLYSDRPVEGAKLQLLGAPADNIGIVEFRVTEDEVFARLVNHGAARLVSLEARAGRGQVREEKTLAPGVTVWARKLDVSAVQDVEFRVTAADSFPLDDHVKATRAVAPALGVTLAGRHHPRLVDVLNAIPGTAVSRGTGAARLSVGWDADPGPAPLRIWIHSPASALRGELRTSNHPLMADLDKRGRELESAGLGELAPGDRRGEPLLSVGGKVACALNGGDLHLSIDLNEWQKVPSFPIFWANAAERARGGVAPFSVLRAGRPFALPPGSAIRKAPDGALWSLSGEGQFLAHHVGEYEMEGPEGKKTLWVNLLDERESDTAGQSRELDWDAGHPGGRVPKRHGYAGIAAGAALAFLLVAWLMQLRAE